MKKIILVVISLAALFMMPDNLYAQGFLKKLKEKAESKVAGAVLGSSKSESSAKQKSSVNSDDWASYLDTYGIDLLSPDRADERFELPDFTYGQVEYSKGESQRNIAQIMALRSPFFPASIIVNDDFKEKVEKAKEPVLKAYLFLMNGENGYVTSLNTLAMQRAENAQGKMNRVNPQLQNFGMEIFQLMQQKGINPEKATESQMKDVTAEVMGKKLGIPTAEMRKLMDMQPKQAEAFLNSKYPNAVSKAKELGFQNMGVDDGGDDSSIDKYSSLMDELDKLCNSYLGITEAEDMVNRASKGSVETLELARLNKEIILSWAKSDSCAKVVEMETANHYRLEKWMKDNNKGYNDSYPSWWKESREEQNKVIDNWNILQAERWNAKLRELESKSASILKRVVEIDAQIDKIGGGNKTDISYRTAKVKVSMFFSVLRDYLSMPYYIISCPKAAHVPTTEVM